MADAINVDVSTDPAVAALAAEHFPEAQARAARAVAAALSVGALPPLEQRGVRGGSCTRRDPLAECSVLLTGDARIRDLNKTWRGRDAATNVLAFPLIDWADPQADLALAPAHLGDIAVSLPVVLREADEAGKPPQAHLDHMLVHGALHLLGHDHADDAEAEAMEALERAALGRLT